MWSLIATLALIVLLEEVNTAILERNWLQESKDNIILPNLRESLTDCRFRFYKYGKNKDKTPAFGQTTHLREFTHLAAIGWTQPDSTIIWNCGGSLIWENYILTAAHCAADHQNNAPDVARFVNLDLFNDTNNQFAQLLKIVEIIRHPEHKFSARYHDIALMRLERNVKLHDTVVPACLWTDDEIRFKTFEATGWGDTGFGEARTRNLLKVALRPIANEQCNQHYLNISGLHNGLHTNQLCAGDAPMNTCSGDSGGPLQVKLLHNTRQTPFLVGVTSFGTACGLSVPGVYTRVAPYVPWIISVLKDHGENASDWTFKPQACALRYAEYRAIEPRVLFDKWEDLELKRDRKSMLHLFQTGFRQQVSIHWNGTEASESNECFGVIIDDRTIVTLAQCASKNGKPPAYVIYQGNKTISVIRSHVHPNWKDGSLYENVGLLQLRKRFSFSSSFQPACVWEVEDLPRARFFVSGRGLFHLNTIKGKKDLIETDLNLKTDVLGLVEFHKDKTCTPFRNGTPEEHFCFGAEPFLVPGTCQQSLGGPLERYVMRSERTLNYVFALNLLGRDCGYGESALGVRLAYHLPWINSILFPKREEEVDLAEPKIIPNNDLKDGDTCSVDNNEEGMCISAANCPKMLFRFNQNQTVQFCGTRSVLCCPLDDIRNETDAEWNEIDSCAKQSLKGNMKSNLLRRMVKLIWTEQNETRSCTGIMITSRTFVTAASCLDGDVVLEYVSIDHSELPMLTYMVIEKVIVHPEYDGVTKRHNIALVRTVNRTELSFGKTPACLWSNKTHTPFYLVQVGLTEKKMVGPALAFTKFNSDCTKTFGRTLTEHELCVDIENPPYMLNVTVTEGMPAFWRSDSHTYLIGIASYASPNDSSVYLHTRLTPYIGWIKSAL